MKRYRTLLTGCLWMITGILVGGRSEVMDAAVNLATKPDTELLKAMMNIGGVLCMGCLMMLFAYRLADKYGAAFVGAIVKASESMACQAQCVSELKDCVKDMTRHGNGEHQELILGQKVMAKELERLTCVLEELKKC